MGSYITSLWWGGDPDIPNSISEMSRRDVYAVQSTWAVVNAKSAPYGMELFLRVFRKDTNTQNFFRNIQGLPEEKIRNKAVFKAHIQNLMGSINTAVVNLNQPEVVAALMNKLGDSHHIRHIEVKHFEVFRAVLIEFLSDDLKLSESILGSWGRFVDFIYKHIFERLKD